METRVDVFPQFAAALREGFARALAWGDGHLYEGAARNPDESITERYLATFNDEIERQHHNCSACKMFLSRYGRLQVINARGEQRSAIFGFIQLEDVPDQFKVASVALCKVADNARLKRAFLTSLPELGLPVTGPWHHMAVPVPKAQRFERRPGGLTAGQRMAELSQEFDMLRRGITTYSLSTFEAAVTMLESDSVYRADKFVGPVRALRDLKVLVDNPNMKQTQRDALLWRAVVTLPTGAVRGRVIYTLLDDLQGGMGAADAKRRFDDKVNPLRYQMPQAAPSAGNIAQAEKLVEEMGLRPALARRYAALDELGHLAIWVATGTPGTVAPAQTPAQAPAVAPSAFSALSSSIKKINAGAAPKNFKGPTMTFVKFMAQLDRAAAIEVVVPDSGPFGAVTAPVDADAPPLFAWDDPDQRNAFSWYKWVGASAADFNLTAGKAVPLDAILLTPSMLHNSKMHDGRILVIAGAADKNVDQAGLGLFPELMRPELRAVRATIHAHSMTNRLGPAPDSEAVGLVLRKGLPISLVFRVTNRGSDNAVEHFVDRWE